MPINVIISSVVTSEASFLRKCGRENGQPWNYASTNGTDYVLNKLCNNFRFILINPAKLKNDEVEAVLKKLRDFDSITIWLHTTDQEEYNIHCDSILEIIGRDGRNCNAFRHHRNEEPDEFMRRISE